MTENEHTWLISGDAELATHVARRAARANITSDELVQRILTAHLDTPENVAIAEQRWAEIGADSTHPIRPSEDDFERFSDEFALADVDLDDLHPSTQPIAPSAPRWVVRLTPAQSRRAEVLLVEGRAEEVIQRLLHAPLAVLG